VIAKSLRNYLCITSLLGCKKSRSRIKHRIGHNWFVTDIYRSAVMQKQLLRLPHVQEVVGLSRSEIYRLISIGRFPRPVPLGERARAWDSDEIQGWVQSRINARTETIRTSEWICVVIELQSAARKRAWLSRLKKRVHILGADAHNTRQNSV